MLEVAPRATAFARTLVADPNRADDVVRECLYRLLRRADKYDLERDGVRQLFQAVTNLCINQAARDREVVGLGPTGPDDDPLPLPDPAARRPPARHAGRSAVPAAGGRDLL